MREMLAWLDQRPLKWSAILTSVVVLVIAVLAISLLKRLLKKWLNNFQPRQQLSNATILTIIRVVTATFWLIAVLLILDAWSIGLAGLWGLLVSAIAVIGVGFLATWAMVSNITANFFLSIWRPFRPGDTIVLLPENIAGRIIDRNLLFTLLHEKDGSVVNVPNNFFFQKMFRVVTGSEQSS